MDGVGNCYVADGGNHTIRKVVVATASVTTFIGVAGQTGVGPGPLPARLNMPTGVAVSAAGAVFVTDGMESAVLGAP